MIILSKMAQLLPLDSLGNPNNVQTAPQLSSFTATAVSDTTDGYIHLKWAPTIMNTIFEYNLYKSIVGFQAPTAAPYGLSPGDDMTLNVNNNLQTITFPTEFMTTAALVAFLNTVLVAATAYDEKGKLMIRANAPGTMDVISGTALPKFGQTPRVITEKSEYFLMATVPTAVKEYNDIHGFSNDWYSISTVTALGIESLLLPFVQPIPYSGYLCHIQGFILDLQGRAIPDVPVTARLIVPPKDYALAGSILNSVISTLSGEDGSFTLSILQGTQVYFEINETKVSDAVLVPFVDNIAWTELPLYSGYLYVDNVQAI